MGEVRTWGVSSALKTALDTAAASATVKKNTLLAQITSNESLGNTLGQAAAAAAREGSHAEAGDLARQQQEAAARRDQAQLGLQNSTK
jgi:hypothetical protein